MRRSRAVISSRTKFLAGIAAILVAFLLDQVTKAAVMANADVLQGGIAVMPGFNLVIVRNTGVSFGMLGGMPRWSLITLTLIICAWLIIEMQRSQRLSDALAYGLIIGGALGNVLDRLRQGGVTDFLDFYLGRLHWPAFNLADTVIFIGVALLFGWPFVVSARKPRPGER